MTGINKNTQLGQSGGNAIADYDFALQKLIIGNKRFIEGKNIHPNLSPDYRTAVAENPRPYAVVLSCSDSRVPPELIFDCGLGDLFIIRVAGNILNNEIIGSIEYAVEYFGSKLVVVMGHKHCGAVTAAVQGGSFPGQINSLLDAIQPAVKLAQNKIGDLVENSVIENIRLTAEKLISASPLMARHLDEGKIKLIGAYYNVDDGSIAFNK